MIVLIEYDRARGIVLHERMFEENEVEEANEARLRAELASAGAENIEIVILRSHSRRDLIVTHGRYFQTLEELSRSA